ncbi:MAG: DUF2892 domain-containing protein [Flavobacteriales bacterium]|nr:DUF2892 domain-containing protein [Flavobacteriales bacterium]MBP9081223.1 DUF2892 domain-containing protein [Flavobacteriales bacterium]
MRPNMGQTDRWVRILAAIAIGALYFTDAITGTWGVVLLAVAAVFLATGFFRFCPLYALVGLRTNKAKGQ